MFNKKLVLENGSCYYGFSNASNLTTVGKLKYCSCMVGYQEVITDESLKDTILVMGYPLIGNYGFTNNDYESDKVTIAGLVCKEITLTPTNFLNTLSLEEVLADDCVNWISGVDTRKLANELKQYNFLYGCIVEIDTSIVDALDLIKNNIKKPALKVKKTWHSRTKNPMYNILLIDCGVNKSLIKTLNNLSCNITVASPNISMHEVNKINPDGIIISNGNSNPYEFTNLFEIINSNPLPILGTGLGAQIISVAMGKNVTEAMVYYSCNHPAKNVITNKINIVTINVNYLLEKDDEFETTYIDVSNNNILGLRSKNKNLVQFNLNEEIINEFLNIIKESKDAEKK